MLLKQAQNFLLLRFSLWRAGTTAAGVKTGEPHWRRAALVLAFSIRAAIEQTPHRLGTTRAHGAVQRRRTILVAGIWISTRSDEADNGRCLRLRIPRLRARHPNRSGMKRLGGAPVPGAHVCALGNERLRNFFFGMPPRRCAEPYRQRKYSARSGPDSTSLRSGALRQCKTRSREHRRCGEQRRRHIHIACGDRPHQLHQRGIGRGRHYFPGGLAANCEPRTHSRPRGSCQSFSVMCRWPMARATVLKS
jgi:hypothetical protein